MKSPALAPDVLVVDAGNSKLLAVLYEASVERARWRCEGGRDARSTAAACRAIAASVRDLAPGVRAVVSSVAPRRVMPLLRALQHNRVRTHTVSWRDPWPFRLTVRQPQTVGTDRLANVAGLVALGVQRGVAIDVGTAITFDVLRDGVFPGGLIAAGMQMARRALHTQTEKLPLALEPVGPPRLVGRETREALDWGVAQVVGRGVASTAAALRRELGPGTRLVLTGGAAAAFEHSLPASARREPDLQLHGLRLLAARLDAHHFSK